MSEYRRHLRRNDQDRYDDFDPLLSQLRAAVVTHENLAKAEESYQAARALSADALAAQQDIVKAAQLSTNFSDQQMPSKGYRVSLRKPKFSRLIPALSQQF